MALVRRQRANTDIWPGFVDALASLLMVIIFLLMIFVVSQLYLNEEIIGCDKALGRLQGRVAELADMLALERESSAELRTRLSTVREHLRASLAKQDDLKTQLFQLRGENASLTSEMEAAQGRKRDLQGALEETRGQIANLEQDRQKVSKDLEDAYKVIAADQKQIKARLRELAELEHEVKALISLRDELQGRLAEKALKLDENEKDLVAARAETALLNDQLQALNDQITELNALLETYEARDTVQQAQIVDLGKRLNVALAGKVRELARYRSEFFGKLREILGNRSDIRIVDDRFVFQSEVLFDKGEAELGPAGKLQLIGFADTLAEIAAKIPKDIDWVLQVNGHTDKDPISTARFPSNWELSTARAISVVKFLESRGIDPSRMSAAGFAEYQPLDPGDSPEAYRRNRRIEMKFTNR